MDLSDGEWHKASYSTVENDNCVELAAFLQTVAVRDSTSPTTGHILLTRDTFRKLAAVIKTL
ncbi:DUF397 domain-containing protein [Actinomadura parmotrematis]|uniref:DUF397 domain-containing protein n=1 Tax=Actinomadura parmotrematis TaxID=2864039 RepID=A0ABS7FWF7_9ACTN|nr:DUF397 domain-containing protein [Actinomadura parmotrematis]MBW8484014.1 DUF397 domain-containing protein [Actinomadura parmotrematis]